MIEAAKRLDTVQEYYFSKKLREVRELASAGKPIINMGIGSPDLLPPTNVINAIQESFADATAHKYQSYQGLPELRNAISKFYNEKFGVASNPENEILPLMGSKEGIMHISMAFLNEGDKVLIPNPGYPTYTSVTKLVGANPIFYNLNDATDWQPNFEELEALDLSNVKIMWVNYPHMPTGTNATFQTFEKLVAFGKKHHILIVNDNPYSFILNDNPISILQVDGAKDIALELNSLSKTFNMAGWRVGMVLGNANFINQILKVKSNMDSGMFYGIQKGAIEALHLSDDWFIAQNKIYEERRNLIFQLADTLNCTYNKNSTGLFVWAKIPAGKSSEEMADEILYGKDIFITPGTVFGSQGEGYIRFSLCITKEVIKEAINRFA
ncbi:aminotransferase class I/II-fold pyridoxal phosphate-dependent enzyme [Tenacibaculum finnmarkense]|uniref:pyridoxal phosphate-dependent aminotransferase n=1 Tax=Tenacibaculum finnmarkense TaxID=2781243 RepID=UPI00187B9C79|nr:aminotransferase class I/II-fold pyridoxal phosphate-dependent enzyme [Tenacibaculum finnmarkense]MBE7634326.1 aminotransferase class I/II-fold pyridoxal phosphate-dependent enzyme [Tenacibaculum finnmarkense genomovar ulcerans]MCD8400480.1 aminotransferase class I/II-fold pyridoxal phosphate-dependent enzyme [Tenacibaculum finnmarkense genomovar ulcerans]MCD8430273.1 aminotransferase class I/II-fold pyridoxal phosphate-dependent enzyme [Tenacibaculum finnmarkense genomovar ulcerans]MCG87337